MGLKTRNVVWILLLALDLCLSQRPKNLCAPKSFLKGLNTQIACVQCIPNGSYDGTICARCKNTPTKQDGSCGIPGRDIIPIKNCEEYFEYNKRCLLCRRGYYLNSNECIKADLPFCSVVGFKNRMPFCYSCEGGEHVPSLTLDTGCIRDLQKAQEIHTKVGGQGCQVIAVNLSNPTKPILKCSLCKNGFILKQEETGLKEQCIKPVAAQQRLSPHECSEGCAACDSRSICSWCNHYDNYFMVDRFNCVKHSIINNFGEAIFLLLFTIFVMFG